MYGCDGDGGAGGDGVNNAPDLAIIAALAATPATLENRAFPFSDGVAIDLALEAVVPTLCP